MTAIERARIEGWEQGREAAARVCEEDCPPGWERMPNYDHSSEAEDLARRIRALQPPEVTDPPGPIFHTEDCEVLRGEACNCKVARCIFPASLLGRGGGRPERQCRAWERIAEALEAMTRGERIVAP